MSNDVEIDTLEICIGDYVELYAESNCSFLVYDDFDAAVLDPVWSSSTTIMFTNPCPPLLPPASGIVCWMGSKSDSPRFIESLPLSLQSGVGYTIDFDMKYGDHQTSVNCEDPDEPDEGVHLQYSIDGGQTWTDINQWIPQSTITGPLYTWSHYNEIVPQAAYTPTTQFRWFQGPGSSFEWDHWGIDNVEIKGPSSITVNWSTGDATFTPPPIYPLQTTYISCSVNDPVNGGYAIDSVLVIVNPLPLGDLGNDTTICVNDLLILHGGNSGYDYIWSNGDVTEYIVAYSSTPDTTITYSVIIIDEKGCIGYDTINVTFDPCASIKDTSIEPYISIFPNPSSGKFKILFSESSLKHLGTRGDLNEELEVKIMNIQGQLLRKQSFAIDHDIFTADMDISSFGEGVYYIQLRNTEFVKILKLIIR